MKPEDILAATLWAEDRSGGVEGMEPIAGVILNRVANPGWWGRDAVGVCLKHGQFSCWSWADPNFRKLLTVDHSDSAYAAAFQIALTALRGDPINRANGADHYYLKGLPAPAWAVNATQVYETPHHLFFKIGLVG